MILTLPTLDLDRILFLRKQRQTSKPKTPKSPKKPKSKKQEPPKVKSNIDLLNLIEQTILLKLIEEKLNAT